MSINLQIGEFTLNMDRFCLIGPEGPIELRPKTFQVMKCLAERAGRVVSREELLEAVWPNVTVTDDALTHCISEARRALGGDGASLIETVPRRGYILTTAAVTPSAGQDPILPDWCVAYPHNSARLDIHLFARLHRLAVIATVSPDGQPQSAVVRIVVTDSFELIIDARRGSRKVQNLSANPKVGVTLGWDMLQTLQIDGLGEILADDALADAKHDYAAQYPESYRARQALPDLVYIRVTPTWMRFTDFRTNPANVFTLDLSSGGRQQATEYWRADDA
jgi:DNA-binding winged helix-turn-helix (wHTH) protein/general stress protein 26